MDALCWVFGFRSQSIRSENASQLLNDQARKEEMKKCKTKVHSSHQ